MNPPDYVPPSKYPLALSSDLMIGSLLFHVHMWKKGESSTTQWQITIIVIVIVIIIIMIIIGESGLQFGMTFLLHSYPS
jgi:hypothetical protein